MMGISVDARKFLDEYGVFVLKTVPFLVPPSAAEMARYPAALVEQPAAAQAHPIRRAGQWHAELQATPDLRMSDIAKREGLTRARVTQIMNLLELTAEIREHLLGLETPAEIRSFSERRLRAVAAIRSQQGQLRAFWKLVPPKG